MRAFRLLRFVSAALLLLGCEKETPKPQAEPPPPEPPPSAAEAKPAPQIPTTPPPPPAPTAIPAPADVAAAPKDAQKTKSGLVTKVLTKGTGKTHPGQNDQVKVSYAGWTKDGKMFDASAPDSPTSFGVGNVIPGWTEALELMVEGEKRRLWIPAKLAYGETPTMPGAPTGDLVFDVELHGIVPGPATPKDLVKPPKDATKTTSGLVYKVLTKGTGKDHPGPTSRVSVQYSGWTKDGKLFDSSIPRGAPITLPLNAVIKGWTEALQLLVVGDKARLWIPAALAYGEHPAKPGAPAGDLVFDVELVSIQ
jgi:peptidylprolyl isomerase